MPRLLFLSRLAFICNIFFVLAFTLQISNWIHNEDISSSLLILGYLLGFILNPVVNIVYLLLLLFKRKVVPAIPAWLVMGNAMFLLIQIFYILYINK